jgi:hypothetical protein
MLITRATSKIILIFARHTNDTIVTTATDMQEGLQSIYIEKQMLPVSE